MNCRAKGKILVLTSNRSRNATVCLTQEGQTNGRPRTGRKVKQMGDQVEFCLKTSVCKTKVMCDMLFQRACNGGSTICVKVHTPVGASI